jgi:glutamine transport system substrate-binding protein
MSNEQRFSRRRLVVGVDEAPPAPMNFGLPGSPEFRGFEVDLTNAIANQLAIDVEYRCALWRVLLTQLSDGDVDIVCSAATITPARREVVEFSDPYLDTQLAIVMGADRSIEHLVDLAHLTTGVRISTVAEEFARAQIPADRIRTFDLNTDTYSALTAGEVDVVIDDLPIAAHFARTMGLGRPMPLPGTEAEYGYVFTKGNDHLRQRVNDALRSLREDGTWRTLRDRWWPPGTELG